MPRWFRCDCPRLEPQSRRAFEISGPECRRIELVIAVAAGLVTEGELPNNEKDSILNHAQLPSRHV